MASTELFALIGLIFASLSVIGNDAVQTLGTFIASNRDKVKWWIQWLGASAIMVATLCGGWYINGGDISFGRLEKIPHIDIQWYHAMAPAVLLALTRFGIPVSTTFLVLSAFASTVVFEKMLIKSMLGYSVAAVSAYALWMIISKLINERGKHDPGHDRKWRVAQWTTTGFLWFTWISHDMANIAVFLPRQLSLPMLLGVCALLTGILALIFWERGGKIQEIVIEKTSTAYVRSATIIDGVYALLLYIFKEVNNIPMSTTWVFVGLLCGRELAIAASSGKKIKKVFPIVGKDFLKIMLGLAVSVAIVLLIGVIRG